MKKISLYCFILSLFTAPSFSEMLIFSAVKGTPVTKVTSEIITEAYHRIDIDVKIDELPAERAINLSNKGKYDGELFRIKGINKKFSNLIMIENACYWFDTYCFVSEENRFEVNGWNSIPKDYSVGAKLGVKYVEKGVKAQGLKTDFVPTNIQAFKMLNIGRVKLVVTNAVEGDQIVSKLNLKKIIRLEPYLQRIELFHYLHNKNSHIIPKTTQALKNMKDDGTLETILKKY